MESKYIAGTHMSQFEHIPQISCYNNNYYKGFDRDLLFGKSDDDNTTEWYLVNKRGCFDFVLIGESYSTDTDEILHVYSA